MTINPSSHNEHWQKFLTNSGQLTPPRLGELFDADKHRAANFTFHGAGLTLDISRQHIAENNMGLLLDLAQQLRLPVHIKSMLNGEKVNTTEQRQALHSELRSTNNQNHEVQATLDKIRFYSNELHQQRWLGYTGKPIRNIVNIGIGGSDLGPKMACSALNHYKNPEINVQFISNADQADCIGALNKLDPETTAFLVVSKSWTTQETQLNAELAKQWLLDNGCKQNEVEQHFIAITTKNEQAIEFGISKDRILPMWDWVGGRFSLWSAVGLSIALATSFEYFQELLAGANAMDEHFASTDLQHNLPVILALTEIWNVNILGHHSQAIIPYSHDLRLLPYHLQQLIMESNGKSTNLQNQSINYQTCPIIWGSAGTVGQHSFHQLLHQGNEVVPIDFILPLTSHESDQQQHNQMIANCLAQAEVLMDGISSHQIKSKLLSEGVNENEAEALSQHKSMPGNRPSSIISFDALTPKTLGALIAMYEHKVFCSSVLWNINAFDQWGVELGKTVATSLLADLNNKNMTSNNPATKASLTNFLANITSEESKK